MYEVKEKDWKVYKELMPIWQDRYIKKVNREYITILINDKPAIENYWDLRRKIKEDKGHLLIQFDLRRSTMFNTIYSLYSENIIHNEELLKFSEELLNCIEEEDKFYKCELITLL